MSKTSTLKQSLAAAAGKSQPAAAVDTPAAARTAKPAPKTVLVGANFAPEVRRVLKHIEAETGKTLKQLLGGMINQLAAEHGKPQPFNEAE